MQPRISVVILTYQRDVALLQTLERLRAVFKRDDVKVILVDNNNDDVDRRVFLSDFSSSELVDLRANLGVAAGRNVAMKAVVGDVVLFLDDDALLEFGPSYPDDILKLFDDNPDLSVVAFRSFVGRERIEDPIEFPHTNKSLDHAKPFETFRFIGVAHAIRVADFRAAGGYSDCFFYGMEEFDLSYQLLKLQKCIEYRPEFQVNHMKIVSGRLPAKNVLRRMYANKLAVAWVHLPLPYFFACSTAWFVKTAKDSRGLSTPFGAIADFLKNLRLGNLKTREPSWMLVKKIRELGGDAWR